MPITLNEIAVFIIFGFLGLTSAYARSEIQVYWKIRNYYPDVHSADAEDFKTTIISERTEWLTKKSEIHSQESNTGKINPINWSILRAHGVAQFQYQ